MGNIVETAKCRFCGQMTQIEADEKLTAAQAEEQATMTCNCTEAVEYQKERQRKEKAMMNVSALFGENAAPDKRCGEGIANILKAAVEEIYTGGLAKVTLNLRGGGSKHQFHRMQRVKSTNQRRAYRDKETETHRVMTGG